MADKVTTMVVKVDLECPSCYKKIKKILAKFPEIRDQVYDVKKGTVTITVVCCNPEKIRDKLCCKGGKTIKSIEIKVPSKTKDSEKKPKDDKPKDKEADQKPKESAKDDKPKDKEGDPKPKETAKDKEGDPKPKETAKDDKPKDKKGNPPTQKEDPPPALFPALGYPPYYPVGVCCGPCYEGHGGGPCYHGHGRPVPYYDNYGYPRGWYLNRYDYFSEENPYACTIM